MSKDVVEDVRFLEIINLLRCTKKGRGRKFTVEKHFEENIFWHKSRNRNNLPSCDII